MEVFKNKSDSSIVNLVERSRSEYMSSRTLIDVNDLGSGSLKLKSRERKVSDIVRYSAVKPRYGRLLSNLASVTEGRTIIEMGTSLGLGSMYLALGSPRSRVITIEGCENIAALARDKFTGMGIDNIEVLVGNFDQLLDDVLEGAGTPGLIYIDGNHSSRPLINYMESILKHIDKDTIIIVDDIHYSRDMEMAWNILKKWDSISVTVDILQMGLLFFRKGINKQDFVIRY